MNFHTYDSWRRNAALNSLEYKAELARVKS